jgi:hypothetical protein
LVSKSKIPPELVGPMGEVLDVGGDGVDALGFHGRPYRINGADEGEAKSEGSADDGA